MKKRVLSIVLAGMLVSGLLIGCDEEAEVAPVQEEVVAEEQQESEEVAAPVEETEEAVEKVISEETEDVTSGPVGAYVCESEEEMEGVAVKIYYWVILNEDHSAYMCTQDGFKCEWSDDGVITGTDVAFTENFTYEDDKLTFTNGDNTLEFTRFEGKVVWPNPYVVSEEDTEDGIYHVNLHGEDIKTDEDKLIAKCGIYTEDTYDIVDITMLAEGDAIVVDGLIYKVDSIEDKSVGKIINGGIEEGGVDLQAIDEGNCYMYQGFDDLRTYTFQFEKEFEIAEGTTFSDSQNSPGEAEIYSYEELADVLKDDFLYQASATVRIEDGKIVEITRIFRP